MSIVKLFTLSAAFALVTANAFAVEFSILGDKDKGHHPTPGNPSALSWDEFKDQCANPYGKPIQREPQNIRIQCQDVHREFVAGAPGEVPLEDRRVVNAALLSDKFYTNVPAKMVPTYQKSGSCLRFKEVQKTIAVERALSCQDILGMKGGIDDYCVSALNVAKGANPKLVKAEDTGRLIDTCAGVMHHDPGKPGDGKGD